MERILPETNKLREFLSGCKYEDVMLSESNGKKRLYLFCKDKKLLIESDKFTIFTIPERVALTEITAEGIKEVFPVGTNVIVIDKSKEKVKEVV